MSFAQIAVGALIGALLFMGIFLILFFTGKVSFFGQRRGTTGKICAPTEQCVAVVPDGGTTATSCPIHQSCSNTISLATQVFNGNEVAVYLAPSSVTLYLKSSQGKDYVVPLSPTSSGLQSSTIDFSELGSSKITGLTSLRHSPPLPLSQPKSAITSAYTANGVTVTLDDGTKITLR